jgi:hypothetical protein
MSRRIKNFYYDAAASERESFVIETSYYSSNDTEKMHIDIETSRYYSEYVDNDHGMSHFKLYRKDAGVRVYLYTFEASIGTIITPEIIDKIGDFFCNVVMKYGVYLGEPLPQVAPGLKVTSLGITLIDPSIKKKYIE